MNKKNGKELTLKDVFEVTEKHWDNGRMCHNMKN